MYIYIYKVAEPLALSLKPKLVPLKKTDPF